MKKSKTIKRKWKIGLTALLGGLCTWVVTVLPDYHLFFVVVIVSMFASTIVLLWEKRFDDFLEGLRRRVRNSIFEEQE